MGRSGVFDMPDAEDSNYAVSVRPVCVHVRLKVDRGEASSITPSSHSMVMLSFRLLPMKVGVTALSIHPCRVGKTG